MQELLPDLFADAVPLALRGLAAVAFTLVGTAVELNALSSLSAGEMQFGLWTLYMGGLALYAGLFVFGSDVVEALDQNSEMA